MKRSLSLCIVLLFCLMLFAACGQKTPQTPTNPQKPSDDTSSNTSNTAQANNVLVVYFSCTGTTKGIAEKIATSLHCDTFEIVPAVAYTNADLNYSDSQSRATKEQNTPSARPQIKNELHNWEKYDTVFIGYPIWWGKLPKIIYTFCEKYDLSDKTVVPFCTSGSTGISTSESELKTLAPAAHFLAGRRCPASDTQQTIDEWVKSLNLIQGVFTVNLYVNGTKLTATMENNSSAEALKQLLEKGDVTVSMHDYGDFEKVGPLPQSLPRNDKQITTTPGDIILYLGNQITIYYDVNSWNFTKLGHINDVTQQQLKTLLGTGDVTVRFSLN